MSFIGAGAVATEFAKSHGKKVAQVMTEGVRAVGENTPISEIAALFETVIAVPRRLSDKSEDCGHP